MKYFLFELEILKMQVSQQNNIEDKVVIITGFYY